MTDDDWGEQRDPLLVRPYLVGSSAAGGGLSPQTWPAATPHFSARRPLHDGSDDPTEILSRPAGSARWRGRPVQRRVVVLASVGAVVVLGAAAAGLAALDADLMPAGPAALPGAPLPAVTGPQTGPPVSTPAVVPVPPPRHGSADSPSTARATSTGATAGASSPSGTPPSSGEPSPTVEIGTTTAGSAPPEAGLVVSGSPADRIGTIRGQNSLCLDLAGGATVDNNQVVVSGCNGSATQTWTLAADGTLRVSGKCAMRAGDATVHIFGCGGQVPATWQESGQLLINAATNSCLTDPSGGSRPGTGVTVAACGGSGTQRWSLP